MTKLGFLILALVLVASCSSKDPEKVIHTGMMYEEVEDILGKPEAIRDGITYIDSSVMVMMGRGSEIPVVNTSSPNDFVSWMYEQTKVEQFTVTTKRGKKQEREVRTYNCLLQVAVVFDANRKKVVSVGFYPVAVTQ
jgi:hypothetical protein